VDVFLHACRGWAADPDRALSEPTEADHPVIHDDRRGHGQIDAESRRNLDHERTPGGDFWTETVLLGTQYIGGREGVSKSRKIDGVVRDFHPNQLAADWQAEISKRLIDVNGHRLVGYGGIRSDEGAHIHDGGDRKGECGIEGVSGPQDRS